MKRVLVALVSICLIGGMAALIPLLAGDPASAATPCASQHGNVVRIQRLVRNDRARLAKDRRHHRSTAIRTDRKRLAADRRRLHGARMRLKLCQANHKPAKTVTPSPTTSGPVLGLPSGLPTGLPTGLPSGLPTGVPSGLPTCISLPPLPGVPTPSGLPICP